MEFLADNSLGTLVLIVLFSALVMAYAFESVNGFHDTANALTHYIPDWVKFSVAVTLGLGTMIGWKRVVKTVGEKVGHSRLTYAQGAAAETVAMLTIGTADAIGAPVSTTHILSSGVAGAMHASRAKLRRETLRNILLAWVFTLPACVLLGSVLFAGLIYAFLRLFN